MMKPFISGLLLLPFLIFADDSLLFQADFDGFSVTADYAKGKKESTTFANPSLHLRMWEGITKKDNALVMDKTEECRYPIKDNFDPRQGTVSLWVAPLNWKTGNKSMEVFFWAQQKNWQIYIEKYVWGNHLYFYLKNDLAPGSKKAFSAVALLDEKNWPLNKWHKLDAVWDRNGMKLYVDGILPKTVAWRKPEIRFDAPMEFPAPDPKGFFCLGRKSSGKDKEHRTAYDNLRIYNRPLSAKEIRDDYLKYAVSEFGSQRELLTASIPRSVKEIRVDGRIDPEEWSDAAAVPVCQMCGCSKNKTQQLNGKVYLKHDHENLYIACFSDAPAKKRVHRNRDGNLWEDDSFEIHLRSEKRNVRCQFIINANGAVFDSCNAVSKWNANLKSAAFAGPQSWSAELAIPLADLKLSPPDDSWTGNFYISSYLNRDPGAFGWAYAGGAYNAPKSFGRLLFPDAPVFLNIRKLGNFPSGQLDLELAKQPASLKVSAFYEQENGTRIEYSTDPCVTPWKTALPPGRQRLVVSARDLKGKTVGFYEGFYYVNRPMELLFDCRPKENRIAVSVNLNSAGKKLLDRLSSGVVGTVRLRAESSGKEYSRKDFTTRESVFEVSLPLPDQLPQGNYRIEAEIAGAAPLKESIRFRVPDMTPYQVRIGADHTVPEPWTAVKKVDRTRFRVLDREYVFGAGPFPEQIVSRGLKLLTAGPELKIDQQKIEWDAPRIVKEYPDHIELTGKGKSQDFIFSWQGQLWFDGMYKVDWSMTPVKGWGKIGGMTLNFRMPREIGRYVFKQHYDTSLYKWKNDRIEWRFDPLKNPYGNLVWLSGIEKGLAWHSRSNANWLNRPGENNIILSRNDNEIDFCAKIISRKAEVKKTLAYTMVFQGTPSRSPLKNWRDHNYGGYRVPTMQNLQLGGGGDHVWNDYRTPQRWTTPSSHKPRWVNRYLKEQEARRKNPPTWRTRSYLPYRGIPYTMPSHLGTNEAEYDYFFRDWVTLPVCIWGYREDGVPHTDYACCGSTGITDLLLYNLTELFKLNPNIGGIYNDCAHSRVCENPRHGCGGIDAFGQKFSSSTLLGQREYMMREYKLIRRHGKIMVNHVPGADMVPFVHDFSDHVWPGEEFTNPFASNPNWFYCESIPLEHWQSAMNWKIRGISVILLPEPGRAAGYAPSLKARKKDFLTNPEWAIRTMTPVLVHDVGISADFIQPKTVDRWWGIKDQLKLAGAKFHGYWFDGTLKSSQKGILVSWYELPAGAPYRYLIVAGNFSRNEQPAGIGKLPWKITFVRELWTEREVKENDLRTMRIPANHFRLFGIR